MVTNHLLRALIRRRLRQVPLESPSMQDTIGELEKLDRLDKCSMATKTKTWTTQREDIRIDPYPRATTGERWIAQRISVLCQLIAFLKSL